MPSQSLDILRRQRFSDTNEARYWGSRLKRGVFLSRLAAVIGGLNYCFLISYDFFIDPSVLATTVPIRGFIAILFFSVSALTFLPQVKNRISGLLFVQIVAFMLAAISTVILAYFLNDGFILVVPAFILGMIFIPIIIVRVWHALILVGVLLLASGVTMAMLDANQFEITNALFWNISGGAFVVTFAYLIDVFDRRSFALELEVEHQHERSELLLRNILPNSIAERLKRQPDKLIADSFNEVTVLFADIVGFTPRASKLSPEDLVAFLNLVFTEFDKLVDQYGLEKIKTIGDAYMVAGGLPNHRSDHADAVANLALDMMEAVRRLDEKIGDPLEIRIGIHSGPVVAGIIGARKFSYDVWGDMVNVAARMQELSEAGKIQVTTETRQLLEGRFSFEPRGSIEVKGKGAIETFFLSGRAP